MVQIIEENRRPSRGEKASSAISGLAKLGVEFANELQSKQKQEELMQQKNQQLRGFIGEDVSALPESMQQKALEASFQQRLQQQKFGFETEKAGNELKGKLEPLKGAMDTLNRMKSLRKKGNLGIGATYSPFAETRKDSGEYEQLGKSLIQYATNIPIRNRIEFETLAEQLYDPTTTDAKAEGILNAMERIISNSIQSLGEENSFSGSSKVSEKKRPLSSFRKR